MGNKIKNVGRNEVGIITERGDTTFVAWSMLRSAAAQPDPVLAVAYRALLDEAEKLARETSPIEIRVDRDSTGVWWQARARTLGSCVDVTDLVRGASEGGTHAARVSAEADAEAWAERLRRQGRETHYENRVNVGGR